MSDSNSFPKSKDGDALAVARDEFITQWGVIGSSWGINRTMAQIHALLMVSPRAMTTDEIMEDLKISRGNAHSNLRELSGWGLVRGVIRKGERKEYFEAEKDVWKMFCMVGRERRRRELDPALQVIRNCTQQTGSLKTAEGKAFHEQLKALGDFVQVVDSVLGRVTKMEQSKALPWALKFLK